MCDARFIHLRLKERYGHLTKEEQDENLLIDDAIQMLLPSYCKFCA
jgi:hypothetical protein